MNRLLLLAILCAAYAFVALPELERSVATKLGDCPTVATLYCAMALSVLASRPRSTR